MAIEKIIEEFFGQFDRLFAGIPEADRRDEQKMWWQYGAVYHYMRDPFVWGLRTALWLQHDQSDFCGRSYHLGTLQDQVALMKTLTPFPVCPECGILTVGPIPGQTEVCSVCKSVVDRWKHGSLPTVSEEYWEKETPK